ncbi:class I SAM-dependent methyltransferase [Micromonospora sp. NPDC048871]|uniref:class I SAM-dependent methyltransferase n=1 Tax=unclassified Micromonospora TaxID=2617518 RepID=UPI002E101B5E|nr:class I SAM-dependent methyltransferase [Micromonospora sp. NBC_01739]
MEKLLRFADGVEEDTRAAVSAADALSVLTEVVSRAALFDGPDSRVTVQFDLGMADERLGYLVTLGPGIPTVEPGWLPDPPATVRQELSELVRAVFGPDGGEHATREVELMDGPAPQTIDPGAVLAERRAAAVALHQVLKACSPERLDLDTLALRFGSDKWADHWYTPHYGRHFEQYRNRRVRLLEIGVGGYDAPDQGGESLRMWKYYFRRGLIHGLDLFDKSSLDEPRLRTIKGSQADAGFLTELAGRIGPLDIVIDDGSHLSADVILSFQTLFPLLRPGGLYVIEDLQTSYWPGWNGGTTDLDDPGTSLGFLKTLVDSLHHQEYTGGTSSAKDRMIGGLHFYHNIAFVEKSVNAEQASAAWIPRDIHPMTWMYPPATSEEGMK